MIRVIGYMSPFPNFISFIISALFDPFAKIIIFEAFKITG